MTHFANSERGVRTHLHRAAILRMDEPAADKTVDLVALQILASEHRHHARRLTSRARIDAFDRGMGHRAAHENSVSPTRFGEVVGVVTRTGDETKILFPFHRTSDQ